MSKKQILNEAIEGDVAVWPSKGDQRGISDIEGKSFNIFFNDKQIIRNMMTHKMGSPGSMQSFKYEGPSGPNYTTYEWDENTTAWEVWKNMNYIILTKDNVVHWYHGNLMGGPKSKPQPKHGFKGSAGKELPKLNIERFGFKIYKALLKDQSVGYIVSNSEASEMVKNKIYKWLLKDPDFVWVSTGNVNEDGMGYEDIIIINPKYSNPNELKQKFELKHKGKKINYSKNFPKTQKIESIKVETQILKEGRYDSFTRIISNHIIQSIKETEGDVEHTNQIDLPYDMTGEEEYIFDFKENSLGLEVELYINRTEDTITIGHREVPYYINTYISEDDNLVMEMIIDESFGRKYYEEMFYKINEDVRHEVEHYLQNIFSDRQQPLQDTADYETTFAHHMDPSEVEALVHGFYRRAKLEKRTLDEVMLEDIQKDIQDGNLTPDEGDTLLRVWVKYAVRNLPHAKYSNSFRRKFIVQ